MKAANRAGRMLLDEVASRRAGLPTPAAYAEFRVCVPPAPKTVATVAPSGIRWWSLAYDPCPTCGWFHPLPALPF